METANLLETQTPEKFPDKFPDKFKDPQSGEILIDKLLQSYNELEKKLSQRPAVPATPDEYSIDCSHGLFEADPEVNARLHRCGCTAEQVQEVYNLAAERLVPMIRELATDFQADREIEKLEGHFGGPEKWQEISRQLLSYGRKHLAPDVLDALSSSFEGVLALHRMMKGAEPELLNGAAQPDRGSDEQSLRAMLRDPRYWQKKDPAFIAQVTEGFKKLYGG